MSLRNKIDEDYKQSIKNKDQQKIDTLRLIRSAIKDKDISSRTSENKEGINDSEILSLLLNLIKQRNDSIEQFQNAKRDDLIKNENRAADNVKWPPEFQAAIVFVFRLCVHSPAAIWCR